jgi:tRNA nucleotidyltransferase (CCA-adding enzyme)
MSRATRSERPELLSAVRALPAAGPLLARLSGPPEPTVYLVGGAVRDLLLGTEPNELDLCVDGDPDALARALDGAARVHDRFDTCTVELGGDRGAPVRYDIARTRRETYAHPGALPEVAPAPIEDDLGRRDFTINAIALALNGSRPGELIAVEGACSDLHAGTLRVLHGRSFVDDPTRLFRLARYAARLGFAASSETETLAAQAIAQGAVATISGTRIGNELRLLAREPDPIRALEQLDVLGLSPTVVAGFAAPARDLADRALELLPDDGRRDLTVLALAFRGVSDGARTRELGFVAGDLAVIGAAGRDAERLRDALQAAARPSEIAHAASRASVEAVAIAGALGAEAQARAWLTRLRHVRLEIDGSDLQAAGIPQGPAIGAALRAALDAKLDGEALCRDAELAIALTAARQ